MCNSAAHNSRPRRESLSKRLGLRAWAIKARDGERCVYCGATAQPGAPLHLDHVNPKIKGTVDGDSEKNLVLACAACNSSRQTTPLRAWAVIVAERTGRSADAVVADVRRRLRARLDLDAARALRAARSH